MGNLPAVIGGILSFGLPELFRALSPQQRHQYHAVEKELDSIKKETQAAKAELQRIQAEGQRLSEGDVATYQQNIENFYQRHLSAVARLPDPPPTVKFSAAFLGKTSTGKTTTINRLYGTQERTGPIPTTQGVRAVYDDDIITIFDVFGENDEETYHHVEQLMFAKTLHKIAVVYTESVDSVLNLARLCAALRAPLIFFRNKCEGESPADLEIIRAHDTSRLERATQQRVHLVMGSAKTGMNLDEIRVALRPSG